MKIQLFICVFVLFYFMCDIAMSEEQTTTHPPKFCPFSIEVYPHELHVGDPLYVKMNFENNTNRDAYASTTPFRSSDIDYGYIFFYLKSENEFIPWGTIGTGGEGLNTKYWQKIAPTQKGLAQFFVLGFPNTQVSFLGFYHETNSPKRWQKIKNQGLEGSYLVIELNNKQSEIPVLPLLIPSGQRLSIKPRKKEELKSIEKFYEDRECENVWNGDNLEFSSKTIEKMEKLISVLSPGTLQNSMKFELQIIRFMSSLEKGSEYDGETILHETQKLLNEFHELERDNLKLLFRAERGYYVKERLEGNKKLENKYRETFGEDFVFPQSRKGN